MGWGSPLPPTEPVLGRRSSVIKHVHQALDSSYLTNFPQCSFQASKMLPSTLATGECASFSGFVSHSACLTQGLIAARRRLPVR